MHIVKIMLLSLYRYRPIIVLLLFSSHRDTPSIKVTLQSLTVTNHFFNGEGR
jgi:hypothetical protein